MASILLKNIYKDFDNTGILHDINLEVNNGEFVVLVGPSGCGKSTTLRLIAGLEEATAGDIIINDKVVNDLAPHLRNIAMVFQNYALYPHKNVRENLVFRLKRIKAPSEIIQKRLKKVAEILELKDLLDRKPAQLSGGQKQRVAMGRAIIRDADLFLFDEPLSNLDTKLRSQMRLEIKRIHRAYKTTSIYVTHDQVEAMTLGDKVVVMQKGFIEQQGVPMDIYLKPINIFVATFIGAPSMNILNAKLFPDFIELENQKLDIRHLNITDRKWLSNQGQNVKLGIRPDFLLDERLVKNHAPLATLKNAEIEFIEPLGFDKEFSLKLGSQFIKAKLDLRTLAKEEEPINLCFDMKRAHIFDAGTGRNLFLW